jgi:acyl carrier protein
MGLDTVELIMDIEKHFGIDIPNEDAEKLSKVGDMHEYVYAALKRDGREIEYTEVFDQVKTIVVRNSGVDPSHVQSETDVVRDLGMD